MSIKVHLTPHFGYIVGKDNLLLEANGSTVREVIEDIDKRYPGFKNECLDKRGKLYAFLEVYINENSAFPDELNRKVADTDEVTILTVVGGG